MAPLIFKRKEIDGKSEFGHSKKKVGNYFYLTYFDFFRFDNYLSYCSFGAYFYATQSGH